MRAIVATILCCLAVPAMADDVDWPVYGGDAGGTRFSELAQIDRSNVTQLKVAWTFHTGDIAPSGHNGPRSGFETTPLVTRGTMYLTTPFNRVIALDPATGEQRWAFDPKIARGRDAWYGDGLINRGVAVWHSCVQAVIDAKHQFYSRVFEATLDARLICIDASNGRPCTGFGTNGEISLRDVPRFRIGDYHMTSAPTVIGDVVVVGSAIDDNDSVEMPGGVVRAFDVRTGDLRWSWEPLPPNVLPGDSAQMWRTGAGNAWSTMVADPQRNLVFVPTGSASPDHYGGFRPGDDKWANSVVALDAQTGQLRWGFQLVHHDLWDYDTAAPPLLATIAHGGRDVPVVVAGNKSGFLFVLNRDTGIPMFGVDERPVPASTAVGEAAAPTQPIPRAPPALVPQVVTEADAWGPTPEAREWCRAWIAAHKTAMFTPPSTDETLVVPGFVGGMNWSGFAYDQGFGLLIVATNHLPFRLKLIPAAQWDDVMRNPEDGWEYNRMRGAPYGMMRHAFFSPAGLPCVAPPWGKLNAVDLATGKISWQVPLGSVAEFTHDAPGTPPGSINLGGPIVTGGGLVFVAGTIDRRIRAFDTETGRELWSGALPATAHAMPMTYLAGGKQYVVIAAGGSAKIEEEAQSDAVVAFALP